jgi:hypothetical protein
MLLRRTILGLLWSLGCVPQSVDRATLTDADVDPGPTDARTSTAGSMGGISGTGGVGGNAPRPDGRVDTTPPRDTATDRLPPDRPVDRSPDLAPPPDAALPPDTGDAGGEAGTPGVALLVVGVPGELSDGDTRLRMLLQARRFQVRVVDDNAAVNVAGAGLVVVTGSCASDTLTTKYRDVAVPIINLEPAAQDGLGMTAGTAMDLGQANAGSLSIVMPTHPLAAGLTGTVGVVSMPSSFSWGRPAPAAQRVATIMGQPTQVTLYAYSRGAMMISGPAPARRVNFFAADNAAPRLGANGVALFNAAIDWALAPEPP